MTRAPSTVTRRHLLAGSALGGALLVGCAARGGAATPASTSPTGTAAQRLQELERTTGRTIGVAVLDEQGVPVLEHRAEELFAMCSIFKVLAVAALLTEHGIADDDWWRSTQIDYDEADVVVDSAVLSERSGPITPEELADAALRFSDNTAGNLLLQELGGPAAVTRFAAGMGATRTRLDRWEPDLNDTHPEDARDTSTPGEIAMLLHRLLVERAQGAFVAARLQSWMLRNTTSDARMRAVLQPSEELADKTGAGGYGTNNDAGVLFRPDAPPSTVVIMTRGEEADAEPDNDLVQQATEIAISA